MISAVVAKPGRDGVPSPSAAAWFGRDGVPSPSAAAWFGRDGVPSPSENGEVRLMVA